MDKSLERLAEAIKDAYFMPKDWSLPKVVIVYVDEAHQKNEGARMSHVLPQELIANDARPGENYKSNIVNCCDAEEIAYVPAMTASVMTKADYTMVMLDSSWSDEEILKLEQNILASTAEKEKIFFVDDSKNRKRPFIPTVEIPILSYRGLGKLAAVNWQEITAHREKPREKSFIENLFSGWGSYLQFPCCQPK